MGQRPAVDWSEEGGLLGLAAAPDLTAYIPSVQARWLVDNPSLRWQELDASLVMADVSGFTPLAERLARRGKIGAEELTDVLNTVFRDLLSLAAGQGGDCLKFGGDAIFLMFTGTGHADRACAAAAAMQRALSPGGSLARALGSTKLKLSLGVHSGRVQLFLAGRTHEELVVAGPAVSETLAMEAAAGAGEVMISEATRTLVG
ncbi:MAG TPA: adenylate/guanylate cyclase domain-containing protein, partial [Acidimicrobiales bacterium]|nr:adenylate/guanylate cyclase domain-containing protein [Acidimicrobiales bacterium]